MFGSETLIDLNKVETLILERNPPKLGGREMRMREKSHKDSTDDTDHVEKQLEKADLERLFVAVQIGTNHGENAQRQR